MSETTTPETGVARTSPVAGAIDARAALYRQDGQWVIALSGLPPWVLIDLAVAAPEQGVAVGLMHGGQFKRVRLAGNAPVPAPKPAPEPIAPEPTQGRKKLASAQAPALPFAQVEAHIIERTEAREAPDLNYICQATGLDESGAKNLIAHVLDAYYSQKHGLRTAPEPPGEPPGKGTPPKSAAHSARGKKAWETRLRNRELAKQSQQQGENVA